jgi:hypothetical protein
MNNTGISLSTALTTTFIVLKLCNVIAWSWWWVLSPLWIPFAIGVFFIVSLLSAALELAQE